MYAYYTYHFQNTQHCNTKTLIMYKIVIIKITSFFFPLLVLRLVSLLRSLMSDVVVLHMSSYQPRLGLITIVAIRIQKLPLVDTLTIICRQTVCRTIVYLHSLFENVYQNVCVY